MVCIKRAKRIRMLLTGTFIIVSGVCYSLFAPKEKDEIEVIKGNDAIIVALTATNTPVPAATLPEATKAAANGQTSATEQKKTPTPIPRREKVNINTASAEELMTLPGIGETRAACIVAYRKNNGEFRTIEDIMQVKGIKDGIFGKIKDRICTGYE